MTLFTVTAVTAVTVLSLVFVLLVLLVAVVVVVVVAVLIVRGAFFSSVALKLSPLLKALKRQFLDVQRLGDGPLPQTRGLLFLGFGLCQAPELNVSLVTEEEPQIKQEIKSS